MSEWEDLAATWQSMDADNRRLAELRDEVLRRARRQRRYVGFEVCSTLAVIAAGVWVCLSWELNLRQQLWVGLGGLLIVGYWWVLLRAWFAARAPLPARPRAIRVRALRQIRLWRRLCAYVIAMCAVMVAVESVDLLTRTSGQRTWTALAFVGAWGGVWSIAAAIWYRRLGRRARRLAYPARQHD